MQPRACERSEREAQRSAGSAKCASRLAAAAGLAVALSLLGACAGPQVTEVDEPSAGAKSEDIVVTGSRRDEVAERAPSQTRTPQTVQAAAASAAADRAFQQSIAMPDAAFGSARPFETAGLGSGVFSAPPAAAPNAEPVRRADTRPLARVQPGEEVWIIETRDAGAEPAARDDTEPGSGAMLALVTTVNEEPREIPLPLAHTDVRAQIHGYIGTVDVTQQFQNPYDEKIEAVYLFPLPEKAAVNEFVMTIGERKIRGILREKEEALRIYRDARAQGYRASLLVQHRPNIFEQKVANIEPGKRIDVSIRYFHTLAYEDGWYSFVFPTVVGPRYNPPGAQDPVAALPREDVSAAGTAVRYLRPNERSAHDLRIAVELDAGVAIEELTASHPIRTERSAENTARVELAGGSTLPNRDFVLNFRVAGQTIKSSLLTYTDPETGTGYFTLMLYPPSDLMALERRPVEMVFVVDTSGSMAGRPLEQATTAIGAALDRLMPSDTFQILNFSDSVGRFAPAPVLANQANLARAQAYVSHIASSGGTQMLSGIRAALDGPGDPERPRFVTFLTDGYIGNESEILGYVQRSIGRTRIFSFGVGNSVNRYLLDSLAREGRGTAAYLGLSDSADAVMGFYFDRISRPALTDLVIDWNGMHAVDVYPGRLPDLFVGRPVVVTGKYEGAARDIAVRGRAGGGKPLSVSIAAVPPSTDRASLRSLWARLRIDDLASRELAGDAGPQLARAILDTALEHGLMSQYTSFIAVDASERTAGQHGTTVFQAVPVPDGVRYETTVAEQ